MTLPTITQIAKSTCTFVRYEAGKIWYHAFDDGGPYLDFPIPVEDAGDGAFLPTMKGVELLRWARKHLEYLRSALDEGVPS